MSESQSECHNDAPTSDDASEPTLAVAVMDVRLQHVQATASRPQLPAEVQIRVQLDPPPYQLIDHGVRFQVAHHVQFLDARVAIPEPGPDPADAVGEVDLTHVIDLDMQTSTGQPFGHEDVKAKIIAFALNSVFPYLRADLQRTAVSVGLPPVTLDAPPTPYGVLDRAERLTHMQQNDVGPIRDEADHDSSQRASSTFFALHPHSRE